MNQNTMSDTNANETSSSDSGPNPLATCNLGGAGAQLPEVTPPGAETEETKRHRASPRTKAFNECLDLINSYIKSWEEDENDTSTKSAVVEVLAHLNNKVTEIRDNGPVAPTYNGKHYVGITPTGERVQFQANTIPTIGSHSAQFNTVVGPFRMKEGAAYVVKNGVRETDKIVFKMGA